MNKGLSAWGILITLSLIWGSSYLLIKLALFDGMGNIRLSPNQLGALRISISALAMLAFIPYRSLKLKKKDLLVLLLAGVMGTGAPSFLFAYAEEHISSALTGMLNATVPIWTVLSGIILYHSKINKRQLTGLVVGTVGILILSQVWKLELIQLQAMPIILVLIGTLCYALNLNVIKFNLNHMDTRLITSVSIAMLLPFGLSYLIWDGFFISVYQNPKVLEGVWPVLFLSLIGTAFALWLLNTLIKKTDPLFSSSVTYFIPVVAIILGFAYGETITYIEVTGMGIMLAGVFIMNRSTRK